jgi:hypothetical protein
LEAGLQWVVGGVADCPSEVLAIADEVVLVFALPEPSGSFQERVGLERRVRLPRVEDLLQGKKRGGLEDDVDVIGHDAPGERAVALAVKVAKAKKPTRSRRHWEKRTARMTALRRVPD